MCVGKGMAKGATKTTKPPNARTRSSYHCAMQLYRRGLRAFIRVRRAYTRAVASRRLNWLFRVLVLLLMSGVLWYELGHRNDLGAMWAEFRRHLEGANWLIVATTLLLMPLNWLAETEKWYQFVRHYEPMPRHRAVMAVLAGVSLSLFTPNRVGEYGGRMLFVRPANQWNAIIANLVGNFCQFIVLLGTGVVGMAYTLHRFQLMDPLWGRLIVAAAAAGFVVMLWIYLHIEGVVVFLRKMPFFGQFRWVGKRLRLDVLREFNRRELFDILRWALIRYAVYATQYFLLLRFFGIQVDFWGGYAGIAGLFLLQTSIPLPPMTGLMARGNMAVLLWSQFGSNELSALAATFSLWVINLILPALIGTFCLLHVNIASSLGYEKNNPPPPDPRGPQPPDEGPKSL
jgi:hypothetical protein